jgi:plasmid stability protein
VSFVLKNKIYKVRTILLLFNPIEYAINKIAYWSFKMAQLLVRNLEDEVLVKLKSQAKANNRSTEAEARNILSDAFVQLKPKKRSLASYIGAGKGDAFDPVAYVKGLRDEWEH